MSKKKDICGFIWRTIQSFASDWRRKMCTTSRVNNLDRTEIRKHFRHPEMQDCVWYTAMCKTCELNVLESEGVSIIHLQRTRTRQLKLPKKNVYAFWSTETLPTWHYFRPFILLWILRQAWSFTCCTWIPSWPFGHCSNRVGHGETFPQHTVSPWLALVPTICTGNIIQTQVNW
jgi:hypothetical protein